MGGQPEAKISGVQLLLSYKFLCIISMLMFLVCSAMFIKM